MHDAMIMVTEYFRLDKQRKNEQKAASFITSAVRKHLRTPNKQRTKLMSLHDNVLIYVLGFLNNLERAKLTPVCKKLARVIKESPVLQRTVNLSYLIGVTPQRLEKLLECSASNLQILDLQYCQYPANQSLSLLTVLSTSLDFSNLTTLVLDGCDFIDDSALELIFGIHKSYRRHSTGGMEAMMMIQPVMTHQQLINKTRKKIRTNISESRGFLMPKPRELQSGNEVLEARFKSLTTLSLTNCRKLTDRAACTIRLAKHLEMLSLEGCQHIGDDGIVSIVMRCQDLTDVRLGGTSITYKSIEAIYDNLWYIWNLDVRECTRLNTHDLAILEGPEMSIAHKPDERIEVFLFSADEHIKLPRAVLKTGGSTVLAAIEKYLTTKVNEAINSQTPRRSKPCDSLQLLFGDRLLPLSWTLGDLSKFVPEGEPVILKYQRPKKPKKKAPPVKRNSVELAFDEFLSNIRYIDSPQEWIEEAPITHCMNRFCGDEFGFFNRKHHCRRCGKVFCAECTRIKTPLVDLGYTENVKVCVLCWKFLRGTPP